VVLILCFIYVKASRLLVLISVYILCALFLISYGWFTHLSLFVYVPIYSVFTGVFHRSMLATL
jgi:hypothetical protein